MSDVEIRVRGKVTGKEDVKALATELGTAKGNATALNQSLGEVEKTAKTAAESVSQIGATTKKQAEEAGDAYKAMLDGVNKEYDELLAKARLGITPDFKRASVQITTADKEKLSGIAASYREINKLAEKSDVAGLHGLERIYAEHEKLIGLYGHEAGLLEEIDRITSRRVDAFISDRQLAFESKLNQELSRELSTLEKIEAKRAELHALNAEGANDPLRAAQINQHFDAQAEAERKRLADSQQKKMTGGNRALLQQAVFAAQAPEFAAASALADLVSGLGATAIAGGVAVVVIGAVAKGMFDLVESEGKAAEGLQNFASRLGLTVNQASQLTAEAAVAGVAIQSLEGAARYLSQALEDPAGAGRKTATALREMGVAMYDAAGGERELGQLTLDVIQKLSEYPTAAERAFHASQTLGRAGAKELLPLIEQHKELARVAEQLGYANVENLTKTLGQADDEIDKMSLAWKMFKQELGASIATIVIPVVREITDILMPSPGEEFHGPHGGRMVGGGTHGQPAHEQAGPGIGDVKSFLTQSDNDTRSKSLSAKYFAAHAGDPDQIEFELGEAKKKLAEHEGVLRNPLNVAPNVINETRGKAEQQRRVVKQLEERLKQSRQAEGGERSYTDFIDSLDTAEQRDQFPVAIYGRVPEIESAGKKTLDDIQRHSGWTKAQKAEATRREQERIQLDVAAEKKRLGAQHEHEDFGSAQRQTEGNVAGLQLQSSTAQRLAAINAAGKIETPQEVQAAYQEQLSLADRIRDARLKDLGILNDQLNAKDRKQHQDEIELQHARALAEADSERTVKLAELAKKRDDEVEATGLLIDHLRTAAKVDSERTQLALQQRLAIASNDGRETAGTIVRAAQGQQHVVESQFEARKADLQAELARGAISKEKEYQGELDATADKEKQLAAIRLDAILSLIDLEKQATDQAKAQAASLYEAIRHHDAAGFFKGQLDKIGENIFSDVVGKMFQGIGKQATGALGPLLGKLGLGDALKGTIFDDPTRWEKENTAALRDLTAQIRSLQLGLGNTGSGSGSLILPAQSATTGSDSQTSSARPLSSYFQRLAGLSSDTVSGIDRLTGHVRRQPKAEPVATHLEDIKTLLGPPKFSPVSSSPPVERDPSGLGIRPGTPAYQERHPEQSQNVSPHGFRTLGQLAALHPTPGILAAGSKAAEDPTSLLGILANVSMLPLLKHYGFDIPALQATKAKQEFQKGNYYKAADNAAGAIPGIAALRDLYDAQVAVADRAISEFHQGHYASAGVHALASGVPIVGPQSVSIGDNLQSGHYKAAAADFATIVGGGAFAHEVNPHLADASNAIRGRLDSLFQTKPLPLKQLPPNAFQFTSPNELEGTKVPDALAGIASPYHRKVAQFGRDLDRKLGLDAKPLNAVGEWTDGAENSIFNVIRGATDYDTIRYSAAVKGHLTNQKAVIPFLADEGGADSVYRVNVPGATLENVRASLDKHGIEYRTLVPTPDGTEAVFYDPGSANAGSVQAFANSYGVDPEQIRGRGEFLGGDTREEGHAAYQTVIDNFESKTGNKLFDQFAKPEWEQRKQAGPLTSMFQDRVHPFLRDIFEDEEGAVKIPDWLLKMHGAERVNNYDELLPGINEQGQKDVETALRPAIKEYSDPASRKRDAAMDRLRRKSIREPGVGDNQNPRTVFEDEKGKLAVGAITNEDWLERAQSQLSPEEFADSRQWYSQLQSFFTENFGAEKAQKMSLAWLLANQKESPSGAMRNVMRVADVVMGKQKIKQAGLGEAKLHTALKGELVKNGFSAKLSDFTDSAMGKFFRTYYADDPRAGAPAVIDIWANRDVGKIDEPLFNHLTKRFGKKATRKLKLDGDKIGEAQYEHGSEFYNNLTDWLNANKVDGGNWDPAQAQAVGWVAMQRAMGDVPEFPQDIITKNSRAVSMGLDLPRDSPLGKQGISTIPPEIASQMFEKAAQMSNVRVLKQSFESGANQGKIRSAANLQVFGSPEGLADFSDTIGYLGQQDKVVTTRPMASGSLKQALDVYQTTGTDLANDATRVQFYKDLRKAGAPARIVEDFQSTNVGDQPGLRLLNSGRKLSVKEMAQFRAALDKVTASRDYNVGVQESELEVETGKRGNANGQGYLRGLSQRGRKQEVDLLGSQLRQDLESRLKGTPAGDSGSDAAGGSRPRSQPPVQTPEQPPTVTGTSPHGFKTLGEISSVGSASDLAGVFAKPTLGTTPDVWNERPPALSQPQPTGTPGFAPDRHGERLEMVNELAQIAGTLAMMRSSSGGARAGAFGIGAVALLTKIIQFHDEQKAAKQRKAQQKQGGAPRTPEQAKLDAVTANTDALKADQQATVLNTDALKLNTQTLEPNTLAITANTAALKAVAIDLLLLDADLKLLIALKEKCGCDSHGDNGKNTSGSTGPSSIPTVPTIPTGSINTTTTTAPGGGSTGGSSSTITYGTPGDTGGGDTGVTLPGDNPISIDTGRAPGGVIDTGSGGFITIGGSSTDFPGGGGSGNISTDTGNISTPTAITSDPGGSGLQIRPDTPAWDQFNPGISAPVATGGLDSAASSGGTAGSSAGSAGASAASGSSGGGHAMAIAGGAVEAAGGTYQAVEGFKQGGARGISSGIGGTLLAGAGVAAMFGPAGAPIAAGLAIAAGAVDLIGLLLPDARKEREKQIQKEEESAKISAKRYTQQGVSIEETTGGLSAMENYRGNLDILNARPTVNTYQSVLGFDPLHTDRIVTTPQRVLGQTDLSTPPPNYIGSIPALSPGYLAQAPTAAPIQNITYQFHLPVSAMDGTDVLRRSPDIAAALSKEIVSGNHRVAQDIRNLMPSRVA